VQNRLERIIFSSATLCSFNTATALITVFPVPEDETMKLQMALHSIMLWSLYGGQDDDIGRMGLNGTA
jgi:streptogramin lyase